MCYTYMCLVSSTLSAHLYLDLFLLKLPSGQNQLNIQFYNTTHRIRHIHAVNYSFYFRIHLSESKVISEFLSKGVL